MPGFTEAKRRMQVCVHNRLARRPEITEQLRSMGYVVEMESCLDQCTRCETCAFALVCGRFVFARTSDEFVRKLRAGQGQIRRRAKGMDCDA